MTKATQPMLDDLAMITGLNKERLETLELPANRIADLYNKVSSSEKNDRRLSLAGVVVILATVAASFFVKDKEDTAKLIWPLCAGVTMVAASRYLNCRSKIRDDLEIEMNMKALELYRKARDAKAGAAPEAKP